MDENEILLTHILQCKPIDLIINKPTLTIVQEKQFEECKRRRLAGEPLQYIIGSWDFMGLAMKLNPSVLIPRPETEQMVEQAIVIAKKPQTINILDLCTGSGCIAIAMAKFCPQAQVLAVDISPEALDVARENAKAHGVGNRINFVQGDVMDPSFASLTQDDKGKFELIVSNPPYVPTAQMAQLSKEVSQEPALSLDGGEDGMDFYRSLIKSTSCLLKGGAYLMMEFGNYTVKGPFGAISQGEAISLLLTQSGHFADIYIKNDLAGKERFIIARRM